MTNPMRRQNRLGRLALATAADYATDPPRYDPGLSTLMAIDRLARTPAERSLLADLVAIYPGSIAFGENQYYNPVRARASRASPAEVASIERGLAALVDGFRATFGDRYPAELATLEADLAFIDG